MIPRDPLPAVYGNMLWKDRMGLSQQAMACRALGQVTLTASGSAFFPHSSFFLASTESAVPPPGPAPICFTAPPHLKSF